MLNLLLTLSLGIIIGWTFHSFFNELGTPNIVRTNSNKNIALQTAGGEINAQLKEAEKLL